MSGCNPDCLLPAFAVDCKPDCLLPLFDSSLMSSLLSSLFVYFPSSEVLLLSVLSLLGLLHPVLVFVLHEFLSLVPLRFFSEF